MFCAVQAPVISKNQNFSLNQKTAHDVWEYSQPATRRLVEKVTDKFVEHFPDTVILPTLGNHEGVPINQYGTSENWLYDAIADQWGKFRLSPQSYDTIRRHGYYTGRFQQNTVRFLTVEGTITSLWLF